MSEDVLIDVEVTLRQHDGSKTILRYKKMHDVSYSDTGDNHYTLYKPEYLENFGYHRILINEHDVIKIETFPVGTFDKQDKAAYRND